jgi:RNA-binding protein
MNKKELKILKAQGRLINPVIQIGKNGLTEEMLAHIKVLLKKRKLIKIKLLKSFVASYDRKGAVSDIVNKTGAELIEQIGFVIVICKK